MMNLKWIKCQGDVWCPLSTVDLTSPHFNKMDGVYIIWHGGSAPAAVYVGQGNVRERLKAHRTEPEIQQYAPLGLFVTWASVPQEQRGGVERFLAESPYKPKVVAAWSSDPPIEVNLPW
jgi:hypothetical protein